MNTNDDVSKRSPAVEAMIAKAAKIRTLVAGTSAMRAAGATYLPRFAAESVDSHRARIQRSVLFNGTAKCVADLVGRVFAKPIVLQDDVPEALRPYAEDIDRAGTHLNEIARHAFDDALIPGIGFFVVDAPIAPEGARTRADTLAAGVRPYLLYFPLESVLGWKSERIAGVETLTQFRFFETVSEPDGEFGEKVIQQIRVLEPTQWRTFRKSDKGEWLQHDVGANPIGKVCVAPIYLNRTGFMTGAPPLEDLADLNIAHYQSDSDQRNILHVMRVPILFGAGFEEKDQVEVGASTMVRTSNPNATLRYVEHNGAAVTAGANDIKDLEARMQNFGLQLLVQRPGPQSATGEIRDATKEASQLAAMASALQDALEFAFGFMAEFEGLGREAGGSVIVNREFSLGTIGDLQLMVTAAGNGQLSRETLWAELKRRGALSDDFDAETEAFRLEAEQSRAYRNIKMDE